MEIKPKKNILDKFSKEYFDAVYVPIYDTTTGQLNCYRDLQDKCVSKLGVDDSDKVLCAGVGTGNEIERILQINQHINVVGVDYSKPSIERAKTKFLGNERVLLQVGDIRELSFEDGLFDKVLCVCVLGFVRDHFKAIEEITRVLKVNGKLVFTYPAIKKPKVTINLLKDSATDIHRMLKFIKFFIAFLPLVFRPKQKLSTIESIKKHLTKLGIISVTVEIDSAYGDYIISGVKKC